MSKEGINRVFGTFWIWKTTISSTFSRRFEFRFSISAAFANQEVKKQMEKITLFLNEEFKQHIKNDDFLEWEEVYRDNFYGT
jgi:guanylate kinase